MPPPTLLLRLAFSFSSVASIAPLPCRGCRRYPLPATLSWALTFLPPLPAAAAATLPPPWSLR